MKKMFLLPLFFCFTPAFSQVTFVKGYLISQKGDTALGEIKMNPKKEFDNYSKVFFKDASGVQKSWKPDKVKGYGFEGKNYMSSTYEGEPMFYRVLAGGHVLLLEMMYEMMKMNEISYKSEYYIAKKGAKDFTILKTTKLKKQLSEFMKDNTDIPQGMEDDKFDIEKIIEVVKKYNDWAKTKG